MATEIAGKGSDNTTALAIMWQGSDDAPDANGDDTIISTMMLPEDAVSTTIAATPEPQAVHEVDAFSDDEIEKAIAEIRGAIEKSSQILK
jgi:protein phosphatase